MKFNKFWSLHPVVLCLIFVSFHYRTPGTRQYVSNFENVLGTSFELKVSSESESAADLAENRALEEIDRMAKILSAYDSSSEFSRWMMTYNRPVKISVELFQVLALFDQWRARTGGALDASAEVVSRVWKKASRQNLLPGKDELQSAIELVKQQHWVLDPQHQTATRLSEAPLMLNSFVKSYIISAVADTLSRVPGIHAVMVNIGGDMVVMGDLKEKIRISDPKADAENDRPVDVINIQDMAVATSGNYRRGFSVQGKWYSHIVDPRTGMPASEIISSTVISKKATDAGAMATAFNILSIDESRKLAASIPGTEYLIITRQGTSYASEGWTAMESGQALHADQGITLPIKQQQNAFELQIDIELAQFEGRFRRPFVAIWVENSNKEPVRNLALWFNKPRWLPDLKEWYRTNYQNELNAGSNAATISSATRPPGKYTIKWDMKDDKGVAVKPGTYTVYIEAAREHGTYQLMKQEIVCRKKDQNIGISGNTEISSASLTYRKAGGN